MMKPSTVLLMLVIAIASIGWISPANATIAPSNPNAVIWRDMFNDDSGSFWDGYVEAHPGDTVVAFVEVNYHWDSWNPINAYASGVWWDNAVLDRPDSYYDYSGAPLINETGGAYGTATQGEYWGNENASVYGGTNYQEVKIDGFGGYIYDMRIVGWTFTIKEDAPLGITTVGQRLLVRDYWYGYWRAEYRVESDNAFALQINVISDVPGDFDGDGDIDADDIDILCDNMGGDPDPYDVDGDGDVDENDLVVLIETLVELQDGSGRIGTKQGDFNLDGFVNGTDLALMKNSFGQPGMKYADGNANCDAFVNGTDLAIMKASFGFSAPPAGGVPEPMTLLVMAAAGLPLLLKRKRKSRA